MKRTGHFSRVPRIQLPVSIWQLKAVCNLRSRESEVFFWSPLPPSMQGIHRHTGETPINIKFNIFKIINLFFLETSNDQHMLAKSEKKL